jgi:RHS repeat-associated protein
LIAKFQPQTSTYYYYVSAQVYSTRTVLAENAVAVHSSAYGPFGQILDTTTDTYKPKLKFSGKEREGYSDLDYFGARYYDHQSYRFNSVDPIINKDEALVNPQLWNLYAYCRNNPITYFDLNGDVEGSFNWLGIYGPDSKRANDHTYDHYKGASLGLSNITPGVELTYSVQNNDHGTSNVRFNFSMDVMMWIESPFWASGSPSEHIEHESGHLIQWAILYQDRKNILENAEKELFGNRSDADYFANSRIKDVLNMDIRRFDSKRTHNRDVNRWAYENKNRAVPTLGRGVLRYAPK